MSAQRRALVIGGSIGGLFAANWLRAIGWDVTVFERVGDDLASRGAGIGTHEELRAVIQRLGLTVDETIGIWAHMRVCLARDGSVSHRLATSQLQSSWARVYRLLKDAFPAGNYRFGMALELAGHGIRVNGIAPGLTATDINQGLRDHQPEVWRARAARIPLGRAGRPEDHAGAAIFLASDESAWITGATLVIDGGQTVA